MDKSPSRLGKALKDLGLALLNATLMLVLLCLLVYFLAASKMQAVAQVFARSLAESVATVTPLRDEVASMRETLGALRAALDGPGTVLPEELKGQIAGIESRAEALQARLDAFAGTPERLLDHAIEAAGDEVAQAALALRGCTAPATPVPAETQ